MQEGEPCRKCSTPVTRQTPRSKKPKHDFYYESLKLSPTDARWKAFGLNIPGYAAVPEQVLNLVALPGVPGSLMLSWDTSARAARYLVEMQLMAPDAEWTLMTTVAETSVTLTGLTPDANVLLRVTAANDGGEAVPSEPVQARVPVALAA